MRLGTADDVHCSTVRVPRPMLNISGSRLQPSSPNFKLPSPTFQLPGFRLPSPMFQTPSSSKNDPQDLDHPSPEIQFTSEMDGAFCAGSGREEEGGDGAPRPWAPIEDPLDTTRVSKRKFYPARFGIDEEEEERPHEGQQQKEQHHHQQQLAAFNLGCSSQEKVARQGASSRARPEAHGIQAAPNPLDNPNTSLVQVRASQENRLPDRMPAKLPEGLLEALWEDTIQSHLFGIGSSSMQPGPPTIPSGVPSVAPGDGVRLEESQPSLRHIEEPLVSGWQATEGPAYVAGAPASQALQVEPPLEQHQAPWAPGMARTPERLMQAPEAEQFWSPADCTVTADASIHPSVSSLHRPDDSLPASLNTSAQFRSQAEAKCPADALRRVQGGPVLASAGAGRERGIPGAQGLGDVQEDVLAYIWRMAQDASLGQEGLSGASDEAPRSDQHRGPQGDMGPTSHQPLPRPPDQQGLASLAFKQFDAAVGRSRIHASLGAKGIRPESGDSPGSKVPLRQDPEARLRPPLPDAGLEQGRSAMAGTERNPGEGPGADLWSEGCSAGAPASPGLPAFLSSVQRAADYVMKSDRSGSQGAARSALSGDLGAAKPGHSVHSVHSAHSGHSSGQRSGGPAQPAQSFGSPGIWGHHVGRPATPTASHRSGSQGIEYIPPWEQENRPTRGVPTCSVQSGDQGGRSATPAASHRSGSQGMEYVPPWEQDDRPTQGVPTGSVQSGSGNQGSGFSSLGSDFSLGQRLAAAIETIQVARTRKAQILAAMHSDRGGMQPAPGYESTLEGIQLLHDSPHLSQQGSLGLKQYGSSHATLSLGGSKRLRDGDEGDGRPQEEQGDELALVTSARSEWRQLQKSAGSHGGSATQALMPHGVSSRAAASGAAASAAGGGGVAGAGGYSAPFLTAEALREPAAAGVPLPVPFSSVHSGSRGLHDGASSARALSRETQLFEDASAQPGAKLAMLNRLKLAAEAVDKNNAVLFEDIYNHIKAFAKSRGKALERIVHMMVKALLLRLEGSGYSFTGTKYKRSIKELVDARVWYYTGAPTAPFAVEAVKCILLPKIVGKESVHIVEMGESMVPQWPAIMKLLAKERGRGSLGGAPLASGGRASTPPKRLRRLRLTNLNFNQLIHPGKIDLEQTKCTARFARTLDSTAKFLGLEFTFEEINLADEAGLKRLEAAVASPEDTVVGCFTYALEALCEDLSMTSGVLPLLTKYLKRLRPEVLAVVEREVEASHEDFITRFVKYTEYQWALLESHDALVEGGRKKLLHAFEQLCFKAFVVNVLACEGSERRVRPHTWKQWRELFESQGFFPQKLGHGFLSLADEMLQKYTKGYHLVEEDRCVFMMWKGTPINFACALGFSRPET